MKLLAHMIDTSTPKVILESVLVVQEFSDVFFKDLSGLPSNKELEFGIDLLPGSTSISVPSYRMALIELTE